MELEADLSFGRPTFGESGGGCKSALFEIAIQNHHHKAHSSSQIRCLKSTSSCAAGSSSPIPSSDQAAGESDTTNITRQQISGFISLSMLASDFTHSYGCRVVSSDGVSSSDDVKVFHIPSLPVEQVVVEAPIKFAAIADDDRGEEIILSEDKNKSHQNEEDCGVIADPITVSLPSTSPPINFIQTVGVSGIQTPPAEICTTSESSDDEDGEMSSAHRREYTALPVVNDCGDEISSMWDSVDYDNYDASHFGRGLEGSFSSLVSQCGVLFSTSLHEELLEGGLLSVPPLPPLPLDHDDVMEDSCGWLCLDNLVLKTKAPPTHHTLPKLRPIYREEETDDTLLLSFASVSALHFKRSPLSSPGLPMATATRFVEDSCGWLCVPDVTVPTTMQKQPYHHDPPYHQPPSNHHHRPCTKTDDTFHFPLRQQRQQQNKCLSKNKRLLLALSLEGTLMRLLSSNIQNSGHATVRKDEKQTCGGSKCVEVPPPPHQVVLPPPEAILTISHQNRDLSGDLINDSNSMSIKQTINVYYRPHIAHFITTVAQLYDIAIFSTGKQDYVDALLDVMDPSGQVFPKSRRYYRQHCTKIVSHQKADASARRSATFLAKDLQILGRPLNEVVLIDDIASSGFLQPSNLMLVPTWRGDPSDTALLQLANDLVHIAK